jgi:hypothetical protein
MPLRWNVRRPSLRGAAAAVGTVVALATAAIAAHVPMARASSVPDPGGPGSLAFPAFSPTTFATPPAATTVKFRWWQPVADTNDTEIQDEVKTMAGNFGGGFEQNGFPAGMNSGGDTPQFLTYGASQQFGQQDGWGSPLWSHRTDVYQQAAAQTA